MTGTEFLEYWAADEPRICKLWDDGLVIATDRDEDNQAFFILTGWEQHAQLLVLVDEMARGEDPDAGVSRDIPFEYGFDDEYAACDNCSNLIRTSPDSYGWTPESAFIGDERFCRECLKQSAEDYLDALKETVENGHAVQTVTDPWDIGLIKLEGPDELYRHRFESGLHGGQTDDPKKMTQLLRQNGVFAAVEAFPSQFDTQFELWVRWWDSEDTRTDAELIALCEKLLAENNTQQDEDPKVRLDRFLKSTTTLPAPPPGMVQIVQPNDDGLAEAVNLTPEEFISGKGKS